MVIEKHVKNSLISTAPESVVSWVPSKFLPDYVQIVFQCVRIHISQAAVKCSVPGATPIVDISQRLSATCFHIAKDKFGSKVMPFLMMQYEEYLIIFMLLLNKRL